MSEITEQNQDRLIIVIPAYNEEENIENVVAQWHPIVEKTGEDSRLFVINDGSTDRTQEELDHLQGKYPMYMAGVRKNGELVMLICIQQVSREQMSLYFLNLFKILSGLVETSLLRALEYQKAVEYRQYVKGTHILKTEYFEERLKVQHDMREQKLASYVLLKVEYSEMSLKEADEILRSKVRENDVWGISESKELYLMLVQTDKEALPIILARLKQAGLVCRQIDEELTGNNRTGENK